MNRARKCFWCRPTIRMTPGASHNGEDFFLRCMKCGFRTSNHVEGDWDASLKMRSVLRAEWRAGRIEAP